jgi:hypothetical protein
MVMAFSNDADLVELIPDILDFGITSFASEHATAQADIERKIRAEWWDKRGYSGELKPQYLTDAQWKLSASYLVLWKYALPQLTNWVDNDRFMQMITFYKSRYGEEVEAVFQDGVEYDVDGDGTITDKEKEPINSGRLVR